MKYFKRIGALLLTLVMIFAMGAGALAANTALIETTREGSITIHKFDKTDLTGVAGDGTEILDTDSFGEPLNGIVFTITLLPDTANSATTLAEAKAMAEGADEADIHSATTGRDGNGVILFDELEHGIYLVQEESNSAVTGPIEAFLVSIPMTDPTNNSSWLYDVHVYPKNTVKDLTLTKEIRTDSSDVSEATADIGDTVDWVISASIPVNISSIDIDEEGYFYIEDALDSRLNYQNTVVRLVKADKTVAETLSAGTDFTLTAPTAGAAGGGIKVDFNEAIGITKLAGALAEGWTIEILVTTRINETAVVDLDESISNGAELNYKNNDIDPAKTLVTSPSNPEITLTGIALYKYWMDETTKTALNDAVFTVYESAALAEAGTAINGLTEKTGDCLIGGVEKMDGYIYFSQADLMDALNIDDVEEFLSEHSAFYLVETTAPDGFALLNDVLTIPLGTTVEAENVKLAPSFTLPITGGSGTLLFTIIGIALIGGAITLLLVTRKKKETSSK